MHRLVAEAFIPNPNNLPQVNHIDGNKENNNVSNLEWCSCQNNIQHAWDIGIKTFSEELKQKMRKSKSIPVLQYDKEGNFIKEWESARIAGRTLGIIEQSICECRAGKVKTAGGFVWRYADTEREGK